MAVQLSPDDLAQLIEQITGRVTRTMQEQFQQRQPEPATEERNKDRRGPKLDERMFRRIDKFLGGEKEWREFKFDVEVTIQTVHPELAVALKNVHRSDLGLMKTSGEYEKIK